MAVIIDPTNWTTASPIYYLVGLINKTFSVYNAGSGYTYDANATYALTSPDNNTLRFEVRSGDNNWFDGEYGPERSEIGMTDRVNYDTPLHISYDFMLEKGAPNTAKWMVVGQIHQVMPEGESKLTPPVAITMVGERMAVMVSYTDETGKPVQVTIWKDSADIERGHSYDMDIKTVLDGSGNGRLIIVRDGKVLVDYSGKVGYAFEGQVYWKEGVYRAPAKETTAATFSDLKISYGDMVTIPVKGSAYIPEDKAPSLSLTKGIVSGSRSSLTLEGSAKAGQEVRLFLDDKFVGKAVAGADGQYVLQLSVSAGSHIITAAAVGADGRLSLLSKDVAVEVGTSSDVLNRFEYVAALDDLKGVYLTDGNVLTVSSLAQMQALLKTGKDALDHIAGGYSFQFNSGTANNRTVTDYDSDGVAVKSVTKLYATDGTLVRDTHVYFDKDAAVVKEVLQYGITGKTYTHTYQAFDAAGTVVNLTRYHQDGSLDYRARTASDGSGTIETFNKAGVLMNKTVMHAAGDASGLARESFSYNITGQSYTSLYQAFDKNNKMVEVIRTRADGSMDSHEFINAKGEAVSEIYYGDGSVRMRSVVKTDGSTTTSSYSATGALTTQNTLFADKSSENLSYVNGVVTSKVIVHAPGDSILKEVYAYNVTGQSYSSTYQKYGANNVLVLSERYHADGTLDYSFKVAADGTVTQRFDARGVMLSEVTVQSKLTDSKTFVGGILTKEVIAYVSPTAAGVSKITYDYNITGQSYTTKVSYLDATGKLIKVEFLSGAAQHDDTAIVPIEAPIVSLNEASGNDIVATSTVPTLSGLSKSDGTAILLDNGREISTKAAEAGKSFNFDLGGLSAGHHVLTVQMSSVSGQIGAASSEIVVDVLRGSGADDVLSGNGGRTWMFGGAGNDTYLVTSRKDVVIEGFGAGQDKVISSVSYALSAHVEDLQLTGTGDLTAVGNSLSNGLYGNSGDNTLDGGLDADVMAGLAGDDRYIVDHAQDVVRENSGEGNDTVLSSVSYALPDNVETLILAGDAVTGTGNDLANTLVGNDLANQLDGRGGADRMVGRGGDDTYVVNDNRDVVVEDADEGVDTVVSTISYKLGSNVEALVLNGSANLSGVGNELANNLRGNSGDNLLDGGSGADRLEGRGGNDTYLVDNRNDKIVEYAGQGEDTVQASVSYALGANVENLVLTGTGALSGQGNALDNDLIGNAGQNQLAGGLGNDLLDGGLGADTLSGGAGNDVFVFSSALSSGNVDAISDFQSGNDKIRLDSKIFAALETGVLDTSAFKLVGSGTVDADDHILYNSETGQLYYDADGSGSQAAIQFATLTKNAVLNAQDFVVV